MLTTRDIRRDILKVTQAELARSLGVDQATISRIETAEVRGEAVDQRTRLAVEALAGRFPDGMPVAADAVPAATRPIVAMGEGFSG